jgi:predicted ribosomally synthesized peptide with nif11-like leader
MAQTVDANEAAPMSDEQRKAFLEAVRADPRLQARLRGVDPVAILSVAREEGFMIEPDAMASPEGEIADSELEKVAGGTAGWSIESFICDTFLC